MPVAISQNVIPAAEKIHKAFKGFGTDEKGFIQAITALKGFEIQELNGIYKSQFGKDLEDAIKSEISGGFKDLAIDLVRGTYAADALEVRKAVKGLGTDEKAIANVLIGRSNYDLEQIKRAYATLTEHDLEKDLKGDLSGDVKHWYVALVQAARDESHSVYRDVNADVVLLYEAGKNKVGTDESEFIRIFASRAMDHLQKVFYAYSQQYQQSMHTVIKNEFSGDIEKVLLQFANVVENPFIALADQLENSMKGLGTDEKELNRVLIRIHNQGLGPAVSSAYQSKYNKSIADRLGGEISGDYKRLALALLGLHN